MGILPVVQITSWIKNRVDKSDQPNTGVSGNQMIIIKWGSDLENFNIQMVIQNSSGIWKPDYQSVKSGIQIYSGDLKNEHLKNGNICYCCFEKIHF